MLLQILIPEIDPFWVGNALCPPIFIGKLKANDNSVCTHGSQIKQRKGRVMTTLHINIRESGFNKYNLPHEALTLSADCWAV